MIRGICARVGEEIFVAAGIDGTYAIPEGREEESFICRLVDEPDEAKAKAKKCGVCDQTNAAADRCRRADHVLLL